MSKSVMLLCLQVISNASLLLLQISGYVQAIVRQDDYPVNLSYVVIALMAVTLLFWSVTFCLFIKEGPMQPVRLKTVIKAMCQQYFFY